MNEHVYLAVRINVELFGGEYCIVVPRADTYMCLYVS